MLEKNRQIPFLFETKTRFSRQDFLAAKCNIEALRTIELWPQWPLFALVLYGPQGCGKTHLAHIFAEQVQRCCQKPVRVSIMEAEAISLRKIDRLYAENPCLVVENLSPKADNEALFHLFNIYQNNGGYLLFTSREAPARMHFKLADLQSRLNMLPSIAIGEPDDEMLTALIVKMFADRQVNISQEVLNYIIQNMQRSFPFAQRLVAEIDAVSLTRQRAITVPIVKEALAILNTNVQQELF